METFEANRMASRTERLRRQLIKATTKELLDAACDLDEVATSEKARGVVATASLGWDMIDDQEKVESDCTVRSLRTEVLKGLAMVNATASAVAAVIREMRAPMVCVCVPLTFDNCMHELCTHACKSTEHTVLAGGGDT